jgi:hypothetical protein
MRVVEEPFVTRQSILRVLNPVQATSERPLARLRRADAASDGLRVELRTRAGQLMGRAQLYSSLNTDAARAFRRRDPDLARALAGRAQAIERSEAASRVRHAVAEVAATLPVSTRSEDAPPALRQFVAMKGRVAGTPKRADDLTEWVARSASWLTLNYDRLLEAVLDLDRQAVEARADLTPASAEQGASTFFGVVARLDALHGEIDGAGQTHLVSRDLLEREGLAAIGQPVAILEEILPGGVFSNVSPAVAIEEHEQVHRSPYEEPLPDDGFVVARLGARDREWVRGTLDRPSTVPRAPLRVA